MRSIFAVLKILAFAVCVLLIFILQTPLLWFHRGKYSYVMPLWFHHACMFIFGIKREIVGKQTTGAQTLYVCNHISYIDINVIGSVVKESSFIAKKEVSEMPIYGYLSTMQQTAYVSRDRKDIKRERNALDTMIDEGKSLVLFPEGTTTDGTHVLPFKSSLFGIVLRPDVKDHMIVQPMTISLLEAGGEAPTSKEIRNRYVWTTEMSDNLSEHLWAFAKGNGAKLRIEFHDPIAAKDIGDRKQLAALTNEKTAAALWLPEKTPLKDDAGVDSGTKAA